MDEPKKKRKTFTSTEVKKRYADKVYKRYTVSLRKIEDADIIEQIERAKEHGVDTSDAFKALIRKN